MDENQKETTQEQRLLEAILNKNNHKYHIVLEEVEDKSQLLYLALETSTWNGSLESVKYLIEAKADIHLYDDECLKVAVQEGHYEVAKLLIENGANIHADDDYCMRCASLHEHYEILALLLDHGAFMDCSPENNSALIEAVICGNLRMVKFLHSYGADIHADNDFALGMACSQGHIEIAKYFLDNGADIHTTHDSPVQIACQNGHKELARFLIDMGANIHETCERALVLALKNKHPEVVGLLLARGARINGALEHMISDDDADNIKYFIDYGLDVHFDNDQIFRFSARGKKHEVLKLLICDLNINIRTQTREWLETNNQTLALEMINSREIKEKLNSDLPDRPSTPRRNKI